MGRSGKQYKKQTNQRRDVRNRKRGVIKIRPNTRKAA